MEQKKNKLLSDMIQNDTDKKMVQLVEAATDLSCGDICTLLEVAHSLPFVGNLEGGDTYINVLTREKESMVIAQYRHPNYDLYKRSIIGEIERREDEPAVYRALEEGISGRGLIGIIDEGRTVVRHTVSPILNSEKKVIGALTYEYPNAVQIQSLSVLSIIRKENRILLTGSLEKPAIIFRMPFFFMMQMEYVHLSIPRQKFCIRIRDLNCL